MTDHYHLAPTCEHRPGAVNIFYLLWKTLWTKVLSVAILFTVNSDAECGGQGVERGEVNLGTALSWKKRMAL